MYLHMILTLLILINLVRATPVVETPLLDQRAQIRAEYLCAHHQWSHDGWLDSFKGLKYKGAGENLSKGFTNELDEFNAYMASPTHKANILNSRFTQVGFGHACGLDVNLFMG